MNNLDVKNTISEPNSSPDLIEYDSLMEESKEWAKEVGMKQSDIDDAVKSVQKSQKIVPFLGLFCYNIMEYI